MSYHVAEAFSKNSEFIRQLDRAPLLLKAEPLTEIRASIETLWNRKGKRLRCHWLFWFGEWAEVPKAELETYAWVVEAVHTASLLHDDVVDEAHQRRGGPTANVLFDNATAVLSGDFFLSDALVRVARKNQPFLLEELCLAIQSLSIGELKQRNFSFAIPLNDEPFVEVSHLKTAALFEWAALVGAHLGHGLEISAVRKFARLFGELFQFSDDILDLNGGDAKDQWADLREGKLNRASYHLFKNNSDFAQIVQKDFGNRALSASCLTLAQKIWRTPKNQAPVYAALAELQATTLATLLTLPAHPTREALVGLVNLVTERVKSS